MISQPEAPTKAELLDALRSSEREVVEKLGVLPTEFFEHGRYENGWTGRQILAHVASIEWTYARLLDLGRAVGESREEQAPPTSSGEQPPEAGGSSAASPQANILSYNERHVEKRAKASVSELREEFKRPRAATIAAVEGADEALLATPITSAGGVTGALAGVIHALAVAHLLAHVRDILGSG